MTKGGAVPIQSNVLYFDIYCGGVSCGSSVDSLVCVPDKNPWVQQPQQPLP